MSVVRIELPHHLSETELDRTQALLSAALDDARTSLVLLRGSTADFCLGFDIDALPQAEPLSDDAVATFATLLETIAFAPRITVAYVEGRAIGGGVGIAAACDFVLADPIASFGLPELFFDLAPSIIAPVLLQRLSPSVLKSFALEGRRRGAPWAERCGLVDEMLAPAEVQQRLSVLARQGRRLPPAAVAQLKENIEDARLTTLEDGLAQGTERTAEALRRRQIGARLR